MKLMIIKDIRHMQKGLAVLTGPLLMENVVRRSDVEKAFGEKVFVVDRNGASTHLAVMDVSVNQTMAGSMQVSLGVKMPPDNLGVALEGLVYSEDSPFPQ
ncbi:hypothetical protein GCM10007860_35420 [Chitiniphilus shinanonensis]|uniref:Uncharacterized protein n=1 Tax=Chitiniphilus shinanonensis TaxID=553088 RepID=A0ABQ6BY64_9NEIS|nr:hypothetical protein [Chitiniphilus shinanonensis]GLS06357.1 hypothetical protein GCM10007860_35420 [Chitiniphilus shinanonensis]